MWYDHIQRYANFTLLFNPYSTSTTTKPVRLIWHENGKILEFDSYSFSPPMPVTLDNIRYYLRVEHLTNYSTGITCKIGILFKNGFLNDPNGIGYAADVLSMEMLNSNNTTLIQYLV